VAVNQGAPTTGQPFPSTNAALFANAGETMAQTLARISCIKGSAIPCSQILATDVLYANVWTTGVTLPATLPPDAPISYTYGGAAGVPGSPPTNANCAAPGWTAQCRITIHYANANSNPIGLYIQNLWNLSPRTATVNKVPNTNVTCTLCHNTINAMNAIQVPAGQLDLTGGASSVDTTVVTSYEQVLFPHDEQALSMGGLVPVTVTQPGPPPVVVPIQVAAPMTAGSAGASTTFLRIFDGTFQDPVLDHTGFLTLGELRLISEWLDIGGQFYNDPFVAPAAN
jgi:hypothetical protein